jgi:transposase
MEAYPLRIRQRIVELYQQGMKTKQIAELFGTCKSGTRRIKQYQRERGTLEPIKPQGGRKPILGPEDKNRLRELVAQHPDATRDEIRDLLGVWVDVRTIGRWLRGLGLVLKKSRCTPPSRIAPT